MRFGRLQLVALLTLPSLACDQVTKAVAKETLHPGQWLGYLGEFVRFELVENHGAFLSLGASLPESARIALFAGVVPAVLLGLMVFVMRAEQTSTLSLCGMALVVGGGLGNTVDRLFNEGAVVDFVSLGVGGLRTGIFNVSDVIILVGAALYVMGHSSTTSDEGAT